MADENGFGMIELLVVIAIITALSAVILANYPAVRQTSDVDRAAQALSSVIRVAQSKTLTSENNAQYGVYLNTSLDPDQYVLFKGASYASRVSSYDQLFSLPAGTEFNAISLGGGTEIVFSKLTGFPSASGSIPVRSVANLSTIKTIYVGSSGAIGFTDFPTPSDTARMKDSRHVHFSYSRAINTASESIVVSFNNGAVTRTIPITTNMNNGQIYWKETVPVGGVDQTVEITTHTLNGPGTQFSIHRSRDENTVPLRITLSGDATGYIMNYPADGSTTTATSSYVSAITWQ